MNEHTETPWYVSEFERRTDGKSRMLMGGDGWSVAWVGERTAEENAANADFVAMAVNSHASLVQALRDLREAATDAYKAGRIAAEPFVRAGNVLAEAQPSEPVKAESGK